MVALTSHSETRWRVAPYSWAEAERLAGELRIPFVVATVLAARGYGDPPAARTFLECANVVPDPFLFRHMDAVVDAISTQIERGGRVIVHGDYDADGITATALMVLALREFGAAPEWYLPSRFEDGFGLSLGAVESIAAGGAGLLITVDCGINYPEEVARAQEAGLDVIVIDHHEPGPLLPACSVVHPVAGDYPTSDLCGVGLAFKVVHALHSRLRGAPACEVPHELHSLLDLVAVGTIGDLVPLTGENRYYVKEGLKQINIGARVGLRALTQVTNCAGRVDSGQVAFRIAPRLNAAGRMSDAYPPLELLLSQEAEEAEHIARELHDRNAERQEVERRIFEAAAAQVEQSAELPSVLVLSGEDWHEGVVGIVASRLVERYHRPALVLNVADGIAKGSGRSIPSYDLVEALNACSPWLTVYGGHAMAAGMTLPAEHVGAFRAAMQEHAAGRLLPSDLLPTYRADAVLRGEDINADTARALAALGPFGGGNPRPRLLLLDAQVDRPGLTRDGKHLRCEIDVEGVRVRAIGWGMADKLPSLQAAPRRRALGVQLCISEWQGIERAEFQLECVGEAAGVPEAGASEVLACGPGCPQHGAGVPPPYVQSQSGSAGAEIPPDRLHLVPARDLRDKGGREAALAQVLTTGQSVLLLVCSVPHVLSDLDRRLPLGELAGGEVLCAGRGCGQPGDVSAGENGGGAPRVMVVEWDALAKTPAEGAPGGFDPVHAVVLDPPYRREHAQLLKRFADHGVLVHLLYGEVERTRTARLLRYLVHPRFAMVCLYRALQGGADGRQAQEAAAGLAWGEGRIVLSPEDLDRARKVLTFLGLERPVEITGKIDVSTVPLYAQAEAEYEECSRLCRTL